MCMAMAGMMFSMVGAIANYANQVHQTEVYNAQAKQNAINASLAAQSQYQDNQKKFIYDSKELQQQGYQAEMKAKQAKGVAMASAGSSGIDASSLSVHDIIADLDQKNAVNLSNLSTKQDDKRDAYLSDNKTAYYQAQNRINSMPYKETPSPLGMILGIGQSLVGGMSSMGAFG